MSANAYFKTACENCRGRIEYPADLGGHLVACPHCGHLTRLALPPSIMAAAAKPVTESTGQILDRIRRESGYRGYRTAIAAIHIILLLGAGLSFVLGLWPLLEPKVPSAQGDNTLYCSVLFALGSLLIIAATILRLGLSLLVDIADATLDVSRRIAPK